ncbi:hypothetical protein [Bdellovibrio sp. KM01]|uniref:hypothetical protein n=1 Tax=Bdellovibrio sp. KM01 TaxID=2748865 RepID=UPI0015E90465|nr:hypothetical protein [Bdellovibrio sp. KM01]QLY26579.1 hypothetical protein HW988_06060 [Bdellovibrio sp. KM01]
MKANFLYVFTMLVTSFIISGCTLDLNLVGTKLEIPSSGNTNVVGPTTVLPMGHHTLAYNKAVGKNRYVGLDSSYQGSNGGLIDNAGNTTYVGDNGIYTFDSSGIEIFKASISSTTYPTWVTERSPMVTDSNGYIYVVSKVSYSGGAQGILKIAPDGTFTTLPIVGAGGQFANGAWDIALIKRTNGTEELHLTPYLNSNPNPVEVYGLDGTYLRSYGAAANTSLYFLGQNPLTKKIYVSSNNWITRIYVYQEDGTADGFLDLSATLKHIVDVKFDTNGYMYVANFGDPVDQNNDPDRGLNVYDISSGTPVLIRTLRTSVAHPISMYRFGVSPDGTKIIATNSLTPATAIDELWQLSGSSYQYVKDLTSKGSTAPDFNNSNTTAGFAVDRDENIYIDDNGNKRVNVYSKTGTYLREFSVDNPGVTWWADHFVAITSTEKVLTGGYEFSVGVHTAKVFYQVRSKTGVEESAGFVYFSNNLAAPRFIGIDSEDQMWFDDGGSIYRANLSGTITYSFDYAANPAGLGVAGALGAQAIGDKVYFLDSGDFTLHAIDLQGNPSRVMGASEYAPANLFAVLPSGGIQALAGGKFGCLAYDQSFNPLYVVIDPANNYEIVSTITSADSNAFSTMMIWTSAGLVTKGTYNRIFFWDVQ